MCRWCLADGVSESKHSLTQHERIEFLELHNKKRSGVTPPASNMLKMVWNGKLEYIAQKYANTCNYNYNDGNPDGIDPDLTLDLGMNRNLDDSGTNMADSAVEAFNKDSSIYVYSRSEHPCETGHHCTEYLQLVLATSYALGCGIRLCPYVSGMGSETPANKYFIVCIYKPGGVVASEKPYIEGESCKNCPETTPTCDDNLCSTNETCSLVTECDVTDTANCLCAESYYMNKINKLEVPTFSTTPPTAHSGGTRQSTVAISLIAPAVFVSLWLGICRR